MVSQIYIDIITKFASIYTVDAAIRYLDKERDKEAIQVLKKQKEMISNEVIESKKINKDLLEKAYVIGEMLTNLNL